MKPLDKKTGKEKWLEAGYRQFAQFGPEKLSIKKISDKLGSSRASFYHYFSDMEVFVEELLTMHLDYVALFNNMGKERCKNLFPDLYNLLSEYPVPLQFSIQLFRNRNIPEFNYLYLKNYESTAKEFALGLFINHYDLKQSKSEVYKFWVIVGEAWYARLDVNDLTAPTLQKHAVEILTSVIHFINSHFIQA
jgi:AcrR family transcriptional regulator